MGLQLSTESAIARRLFSAITSSGTSKGGASIGASAHAISRRSLDRTTIYLHVLSHSRRKTGKQPWTVAQSPFHEFASVALER
jgi:hypothetical protein